MAFAFTGQGAGWATMGMKLYNTYPVYAASLQRAGQVLAKLGAQWSLIEELHREKTFSNVDQPLISQSACTAMQIALVDLLFSWGVEPSRVTGHSSGEIAAAYAASALDAEACMSIAYYRGVVASGLIGSAFPRQGGMIAIGASGEVTQSLIDECAEPETSAAIACFNSPCSITVSGDLDQINRIADLADLRSIWNRRLNVDVAYHSYHMDSVAEKYAQLLGQIQPVAVDNIKIHSSLQGHEADTATLDTSYWVANLTSPVKFTQAFPGLYQAKSDARRGVDIVLELGPHSTLQGPMRQTLKTFEGNLSKIQTISTLIRYKNDVEELLSSMAKLVTRGSKLQLVNVNFLATDILPEALTDLPSYHWNHKAEYRH